MDLEDFLAHLLYCFLETGQLGFILGNGGSGVCTSVEFDQAVCYSCSSFFDGA